MKSSQLAKLGVPSGEAMRLAGLAIRTATERKVSKKNIRKQIRGVVASPQAHIGHAIYGDLATFLAAEAAAAAEKASLYARTKPAPFRVWGEDIDPNSLAQMENVCRLPVSVCGAVMPDAHVGYGLPIGGVLATRNAVIPYAVGVDIACRMKLTVLDLPVSRLHRERDRFATLLREETCFGRQTFKRRRDHAVMDEDWTITPLVQQLKDKAWAQLGTSGGGNHFVEFGELTIEENNSENELGLAPGVYLALLSHSGSRGAGSTIANHYSKLAMEIHSGLPKELRYLAWLDLESAAGQEYWAAMQLMGKYASANHACIHRYILAALGAKELVTIENHHNFAWIEEHSCREDGDGEQAGAGPGSTEPDSEELVIHRKGATPAGKGVLGVIPGSMASPAYVVRGKGSALALDSAAHGAGRRFSRSVAKETFTWSETKRYLAARGVTLLSAGLDEVPMAYKDIHEVMAAQDDLVEVMARFDPKLVRMAGSGMRE